jgi:hypothetical protein
MRTGHDPSSLQAIQREWVSDVNDKSINLVLTQIKQFNQHIK